MIKRIEYNYTTRKYDGTVDGYHVHSDMTYADVETALDLYIRRITLRNAWCAADQAWQLELQRVYGTNAVDARYDNRGTATDTLQALKQAMLVARIAYQEYKASLYAMLY